MRFVFALPGLSDANYRRCLDQSGATHVLMSFFYLVKYEKAQVAAYVEGGHAGERAYQCASSS